MMRATARPLDAERALWLPGPPRPTMLARSRTALGFAAALAVAAVVVPAVSWLGIDAGPHALVASLAVLPAATALSLHARISADPGAGWLAATVAALGTVCTLLAAAPYVVPGSATTSALAAVAAPVLVLALAAALRGARDLAAPRHPVRAGVLTGTLGGAVLLVADRTVSGLAVNPAAGWGLAVLTVVAAVLVAAQLTTLVAGDRWTVAQVAAGGVLVAVAHAVVHTAGAPSDTVPVLLRTLGVALVCAAAVRLLRGSVTEATGQLGALHHQLSDLETSARADRQRLHELGSTLAGITSASQVIRSGAAAPPQRERLEEMVELELQRAQRLLAPERGAVGPTTLDTAVAEVLLSHQSRGRDVRWTTSGRPDLRVQVCADDLREIVNVLLENAFRHGAGPVLLAADVSAPGVVGLRVTDHGTGPAPEVRSRLFEWGARAATSPGQGIGLHAARALAQRNGGHLDLVATPTGTGCTFEVRLDAARDAR